MHVGRKKADICEKQGFSPQFSLGDMYVHIVPIGNGFGAGTKFMADTISVSHIRTVISAWLQFCATL